VLAFSLFVLSRFFFFFFGIIDISKRLCTAIHSLSCTLSVTLPIFFSAAMSTFTGLFVLSVPSYGGTGGVEIGVLYVPPSMMPPFLFSITTGSSVRLLTPP
jgi:hypothetical protein